MAFRASVGAEMMGLKACRWCATSPNAGLRPHFVTIMNPRTQSRAVLASAVVLFEPGLASQMHEYGNGVCQCKRDPLPCYLDCEPYHLLFSWVPKVVAERLAMRQSRPEFPIYKGPSPSQDSSSSLLHHGVSGLPSLE